MIVFLLKVETNTLRQTRQANQNAQGQQTQQPRPVSTGPISDSQKLDALATLLTSTRVAISSLQSQLSTNVTKLQQQTGYVTK